MGTGWRGLLAPVNAPTGDGRRFAEVTHRALPLALKWQRTDNMGHDDSVVIGSTEQINLGTVAEAVDNGWISAEAAGKATIAADVVGVWGAGDLFDDVDAEQMPRLAEDVAEARHLTERGVVGPSVDLSGGDVRLVIAGTDEEPTEDQWDQIMMGADGAPEIEMLFDTAEIAAATLVAIPAFAECRPFELMAMPECDCDPADPDCECPDMPMMAVTAAVRTEGWSDMPMADQDRQWDSGAAEKRVADACGMGGDDPDWGMYAKAFLHVDDDADPETKQAYGFQLADMVDGEMAIVPRAVFAAASVLQGGRGGTNVSEDEQDRMRSVLGEMYARMDMEPPWAEEDAAAAAAVAAARTAAVVALTAAAPTVPAAWFDDPQLAEVTPITIGDDGRIFGYAAAWETCHAEFRDVCVSAPRSVAGYAHFHRHTVDTDGGVLAVGRLTTGHGRLGTGCSCCRGKDDHACTRASLTAATAHYDRAKTLAWVRAGEDDRGLWIAGALATDLDEQDRAVLARRLVSGDWREVGGNLELVEVLALATERPGFPLPRTSLSAGRQRALVAAGAVLPYRPTTAPTVPTVTLDYQLLGREVAAALRATEVATDLAAPAPVVAAAAADGGRADLAARLIDDIEQSMAEDRARRVAALADDVAKVVI